MRELGRALLASQHRICRTWSGSTELLARDSVDAAPHSSLFEDRIGELCPGAVTRGGDMPHPERASDQLACRRRHVTDIGRRASLVVDDGDLAAVPAEFEHRANEVVARWPKQAGRADDPGLLACGRLAVQLRPAVGRERIRSVRLDVRVALRAVEDVVGGVVDDRSAELRGMGRPADVDGRCVLRMRLCSIDIGPRGRMQDEPDLDRVGRQLDVPVLAGPRKRAGKLILQRTTELAAGARDQDGLRSRSDRIGDFVLQRPRTRGSSHGTPCSSGSAGSYSSVT